MRRGKVRVPVLLMHSTESVHDGDSKEKYNRADAILEVKSISSYGKKLGDDVTEIEFDGGLHDLALSRKDVRDKMYRVMISWLEPRL